MGPQGPGGGPGVAEVDQSRSDVWDEYLTPQGFMSGSQQDSPGMQFAHAFFGDSSQYDPVGQQPGQQATGQQGFGQQSPMSNQFPQANQSMQARAQPDLMEGTPVDGTFSGSPGQQGVPGTYPAGQQPFPGSPGQQAFPGQQPPQVPQPGHAVGSPPQMPMTSSPTANAPVAVASPAGAGAPVEQGMDASALDALHID